MKAEERLKLILAAGALLLCAFYFLACFKTSHFGVTIALKQHKTTPTYSV